MNEKEALTRVKTGNFNGGHGFDMQLLVDAMGIIGEMLKSGRLSEVVRCKDCKNCPLLPEKETDEEHIEKMSKREWNCPKCGRHVIGWKCECGVGIK